MADGERRMLFDTRGKRRHVIRVVYAILALLMGSSLFLVVGPFNLGELVGDSGSGNASEVFEERAERLESQLVKDPQNEQKLLELTRAYINIGNSKLEVTSETEAPTVPPEARKAFATAGETWSRYLKQADEPSPTGAQLVAATFFQMAESGSTSYGEVDENVTRAAKAQRIATEQQPNLGSLSTLAIYEYFRGDFAGGDKAKDAAVAEAAAKAERKGIEKQLNEYRKRAKQFRKAAKQAAKQEQQAGKEALQNPFGLGTPPAG